MDCSDTGVLVPTSGKRLVETVSGMFPAQASVSKTAQLKQPRPILECVKAPSAETIMFFAHVKKSSGTSAVNAFPQQKQIFAC